MDRGLRCDDGVKSVAERVERRGRGRMRQGTRGADGG